MDRNARSGPQKIVSGLASIGFDVADPHYAAAALSRDIGLTDELEDVGDVVTLAGVDFVFRPLESRPDAPRQVRELIFTAVDCRMAWELATARGAVSAAGPRELSDGSLAASIDTQGGLLHTFVEREPPANDGRWELHLTTEAHEVEAWTAYYRQVFDFDRAEAAVSSELVATPGLRLVILPRSGPKADDPVGPRGRLSLTGIVVRAGNANETHPGRTIEIVDVGMTLDWDSTHQGHDGRTSKNPVSPPPDRGSHYGVD